MDILGKNILNFLALFLLQVFLLQFQYFNYNVLTPYVYFFSLLWLPIKLNPFVVTGISFITGLFMDCIMGVFGIHALACVLISLYRNQIIALTFWDKRTKTYDSPSIKNMNPNLFFVYILVVSIIHNLTIFIYEYLHNVSVLFLLYKFLVTIIFEVGVFFLFELFRKKKVSYYDNY